MVRHLITLALIFFAIGISRCDTTATRPESQVVVEAYLQSGSPLPKVRLTRSVGIDQRFAPSENGIEGADVEVRRLNSSGEAVQTIPYDEEGPGVYRPASSPVPAVRPLSTYRLVAQTGDGSTVTATTTVPDTISIVETRNEEVRYQGETQPQLTTTPPKDARTGQEVLVITTTSLLDFSRPDSALRKRLTPLYRERYDPDDEDIRTYRTTSSSILKEANFEQGASGRITTSLPWVSVAFYGPNDAAVHVIDDNFYDIIRSSLAQDTQNQGGFNPGEIPNVVEHVNGGTGVFASFASDSTEVLIRRAAGQGRE